jgi:phosphatidylserine/phosphatidylglycerophosphate/cardiolipin synthase-like enzyme
VSSFSQTIFIPNSNKEILIDSNQLTIYFETFLPGDTKVEYGLTDSCELGYVFDATQTKKHSINIPNLKPATIYHLNCSSKNATGESSLNWIVSTASQYSSGKINVFFNKSINSKIALGEVASGEIYFPGVLLKRIDSAKYSIDVCVYSFSGTVTQSSPFGVGSDIADALIRAKNRNVKIRFIIEDDNQNTSPVNKIKGSGIPWITDHFGKYDAGSLMHNKFYIFDGRDSFTDKEAWIITGSWNATNPGTFDDYQNIVEIQDKSLAGAFTAEFNEMWGSESDQPDNNKPRFGKYKTDNTPHRFNLKGAPVELYFAPTDGVSYQIQNRITSSLSSVMFSEMTFTSDLIAKAISQRNSIKNIKVRGLINKDNLSDQGTEYYFLNTIPNSIINLYDAQGAIFHHKYLIIDGDRPDLTPWVLTGSYNLTAAAESSNNENILFIQNSRIANLYLQEFTQRYTESGGKDTIQILKINERSPFEMKLFQNFPNPFNPLTMISYQLPINNYVKLKIYDALGREIANLVTENQPAGYHEVQWNAAGVPSGIYFYRLIVDSFIDTKKMIYLK